MKPILIVMHARKIPAVLQAIRALEIPKAWFKGFTEVQLQEEIPRFIRSTDYTHYSIIGDDALPTREALRLVLEAARSKEVVTGWSNMAPDVPVASVAPGEEPGPWSSLAFGLPTPVAASLKRLLRAGIPPFPQARMALLRHSFPTMAALRSLPPIFRVSNVSWTLTTMPRRLWLAHGFRKPPFLGGSDGFESKALRHAGIEAWCVRDAFVYHLHSME
ncbi:MAG: hypothetical protein KGI26_07165 [Thaumarchaeota archaeon]|nr:hypothetical protein [Nitrososphaerota archaeon]